MCKVVAVYIFFLNLLALLLAYYVSQLSENCLQFDFSRILTLVLYVDDQFSCLRH